MQEEEEKKLGAIIIASLAIFYRPDATLDTVTSQTQYMKKVINHAHRAWL
jgi:hypothetical protein